MDLTNPLHRFFEIRCKLHRNIRVTDYKLNPYTSSPNKPNNSHKSDDKTAEDSNPKVKDKSSMENSVNVGDSDNVDRETTTSSNTNEENNNSNNTNENNMASEENNNRNNANESDTFSKNDQNNEIFPDSSKYDMMLEDYLNHNPMEDHNTKEADEPNYEINDKETSDLSIIIKSIDKLENEYKTLTYIRKKCNIQKGKFKKKIHFGKLVEK